MGNSDQKTQINKSEVIHDLNNLNYLLRAMAKMIEKTPFLPSKLKRLLIGAIAATDKIIAKISGNSKSVDDKNSEEQTK